MADFSECQYFSDKIEKELGKPPAQRNQDQLKFWCDQLATLRSQRDLVERFKKLVIASGRYTQVDNKVIRHIQSSFDLCTRLLVATTPDSAAQLYETAELFPQTATRNRVKDEYGLTLSARIPMDSGQDGTIFLRAFQGSKPMILKVLREMSHAREECALYNTLCSAGECDNLALVPVTYIQLAEDIDSEVRKVFSPIGELGTKDIENEADNTRGTRRTRCGGILMPHYGCTLTTLPSPIKREIAIKIFERLSPAIDYIHSHEWLHGDIKPSNIFIGFDGQLWLGDYGCSAPYAVARRGFWFGTTRYQCDDCPPRDGNFHRFDKIGLIISILEKLGCLFAGPDRMKRDCYTFGHIAELTRTELSPEIADWLQT